MCLMWMDIDKCGKGYALPDGVIFRGKCSIRPLLPVGMVSEWATTAIWPGLVLIRDCRSGVVVFFGCKRGCEGAIERTLRFCSGIRQLRRFSYEVQHSCRGEET